LQAIQGLSQRLAAAGRLQEEKGRRFVAAPDFGAQPVLETSLHHHRSDGTVVQNVGVPRDWGARIDGHIRCTGFQDPEDRGDCVNGLPHIDPDPIPTADPRMAQPVAHPIG
jgi:hypothetical protein